MKNIIDEEITSVIRPNDVGGDYGKSKIKIPLGRLLLTVVFIVLCVVSIAVARYVGPLRPVEYDTLRHLVAMVATHEGKPVDEVWRDLYVTCRVGGRAELREYHFGDAQAWLNERLEG